MEEGVGEDVDGVGCLRAFSVLGVFDFRETGRQGDREFKEGEVLCHLAAESHRQRLYAPADAEHRYLSVIGEASDEQFGEVAFRIDAVEQWRGLLASPQWVIVAPSGEQKTIDTVESIYYDVAIGNRRDYYRYSPCRHHLFVVAVAKCSVAIGVISRDAYDRTFISFGITRINIL